MLIIDKYAYTNNLKDFNPKIKFLLVVLALIVSTITKNVYIHMGLFLMFLILTVFIAGIPFRNYLKILLLPFGFLAISTVVILFSISDQEIFLYSIKIGGKFLGITSENLAMASLVFFRSMASVSATFFLSLTTSLINLIRVFKFLRLPDLLVELLVLIYRFIFLFLSEMNEIFVSQNLRFGYINRRAGIRSSSLLIKTLFISMFIKYRDMQDTLELKLYNGKFSIGD